MTFFHYKICQTAYNTFLIISDLEKKIKNRILSVCGAIAPILYVAIVALGGTIRPEYSHIAQAVSELIKTGAPNKALLNVLFIIYNLLAGLFGLRLLHWDAESTHSSGRSGAWILTFTAF
jgi:hypothetical membrane protein